MARWLIGLTMAQLGGAALTLMGGVIASEVLPPDFPPWPLMIVIGALEGALVGAAQIWAKPHLCAAGRWIAATSGGFALTWVAAMLVSIAGLEPEQPSAAGLVLGATLLGAGLGLSTALLQHRSRGVGQEGRIEWAISNVTGWAAGLVAAALISSAVPPGPLEMIGILVQVGAGALVGLVVGLSTHRAACALRSSKQT